MTTQIKMSGGEKASRECPNCKSTKNWKDGVRETGLGSIQRFICRECGFRFSTNPKALNLDIATNGFSQLCAELGRKNWILQQKQRLLRENQPLSNQALKLQYWNFYGT